MRLVEFYERHAFNRHQKHMVNPEEVAILSAYENETVITFKSGKTLLVDKPISDVKNLLLGTGLAGMPAISPEFEP